MNLLLLEKCNFRQIINKGLRRKAWGPFVFIALLATSYSANGFISPEKQSAVSQKLMAKDRIGALAILAQNAPKSESGFAQFYEQYVNIAELFFYDKTQQLFETATALKNTDIKLAGQKMREALAVEPDNVLILKEIGRIELASANCSQAKEFSSKSREVNPYSEELLLLDYQTDNCLNQLTAAIPPKPSAQLKKILLQEYWNVLDVEVSFKRGQFDRASETAKSAMAAKKVIPEIYYWAWKLSVAKKLEAESLAQKYISSCKALSSRQIRELSIEPNLCKRISEVENYLKKAVVN